MTPSTEDSTYDFWAVALDFALGDEEVSQFLRESNRTVVLQDVEALNILEKVLQDEAEGYQELSINIDTGGLAARRILARMAEQGQGAGPLPVSRRPSPVPRAGQTAAAETRRGRPGTAVRFVASCDIPSWWYGQRRRQVHRRPRRVCLHGWGRPPSR